MERIRQQDTREGEEKIWEDGTLETNLTLSRKFELKLIHELQQE